MSKNRYNKSRTYLLPLLAEVIEMDKKFYNHIDNIFIFDDLNKYEDCIFILHDFSFKNPEFTAYEHKLTNNQYFVDLVDIDNKVLYIFKFPEDYIQEYNNFKNGKYSEFGSDAKTIILSFFTDIYQGNLGAVAFLLKLKQILFKDNKLKLQIEKDLKMPLPQDAELTDIITVVDETFKLDIHIKK